jgi:hypothetical protein
MRTARNLRILPILKLLRKIQVANCAQQVNNPREATTIGDTAPVAARVPLAMPVLLRSTSNRTNRPRTN